MRNFIKAAALVSFLVPAISFADAPKKDAPATMKKEDTKAAPATDAKDAKKDTAAKKDTKTPSKKDVAPKKEVAPTK